MLHAQENRALKVISVSDFWNLCSEFTSKAIRSKNVLDSLELKIIHNVARFVFVDFKQTAYLLNTLKTLATVLILTACLKPERLYKA